MLYKVTPILLAISLHLLPGFGHAAEAEEGTVLDTPAGSELPLQRVDVYPTHAQALRWGCGTDRVYIWAFSG